MREERLLERLRVWEREPDRRIREDPKRMSDSVLRHLQRILNTRKGHALIAEDYGIPDYTNLLHADAESVKDLERSIRQTIQKYEPRLQAVRVSLIPPDEDLLSLRFQIVARLTTDRETVPILFESVLESDGRMSIRG